MNWITYWIDHIQNLGSKLNIFNTGCIPDKKKRCTHCGMKLNDHLNQGGFEYCPQVKASTTIPKMDNPPPPPSATPKKEHILFWMQRNKHLFKDIEKQQTFHLYLIQNFRTTVMTEKEFNSRFLNWQESEHKKQNEEKRKIHFENFGITGCEAKHLQSWLAWNNIKEDEMNSGDVKLFKAEQEKKRKAEQETINEIKLKDYFDSLKKKAMCVDVPPSKPGDIKKTWLIYSDDVETMNAARNPKVNFAVWMECRRMQQDKTCTFDTQTTINLLKAMDLDPALYPTTSNEPVKKEVESTEMKCTCCKHEFKISEAKILNTYHHCPKCWSNQCLYISNEMKQDERFKGEFSIEKKEYKDTIQNQF